MANRIDKKRAAKSPALKRDSSARRVAGLKPGASTGKKKPGGKRKPWRSIDKNKPSAKKKPTEKKISTAGAGGQRNQKDINFRDSGARMPRASARGDKSPAVGNKPGDRGDSVREGRLLYLYGISEKSAALQKLEGIDGRAQVEPIDCEGLVCWVSRVDAREFGDELQKRMENLDWLAGASVRHQRVVSAIHENITVLPARFATLFLSERTLSQHVRQSRPQINEELRRVEGADEYGVKIFAEPKAETPAPSGASGRDYLKQKSLMLQQANAPRMTPEVQQFVDELRGIASASAPGGNVSGGQRHLLWQGSLLVARSARKRLESSLAQFRRRSAGYRIECTGPWPPYSFIAPKAEQR